MTKTFHWQDRNVPKFTVKENYRSGLTVEDLEHSIMDNLIYVQGRHPSIATLHDFYMATAYTIRDRMFRRSLNTLDNLYKTKDKITAYFSAEFLIGPQLGNNIINLGIFDNTKQALANFGVNLDDLLETEPEPGLGNGGLGRLAACYLDSMATLEVHAIGYGIRYEFGIFEQSIKDGWQVEKTDKWLSMGNPWEVERPEGIVQVGFGGYTERYKDQKGELRVRWVPEKVVEGIPYDMPITGFDVFTANRLRLWKADAVESFDFAAFNLGDYYKAVEEKMTSENITKVLYPNDEQQQGKRLRLEQQYFFVACSLKDMSRVLELENRPITEFNDAFTAQLNDTHPSIAIAELMRMLVDEHFVPWDHAWDITQKTFAFTNHTLLSEALEKWPIDLFGKLLPRHLEIIMEINRRFLDQVRIKYPNDLDKLRRVSLIDENGPKYVRMANLACLGTYAINGVAQLHTELLKKDLFPDFVEMWPDKFHNVTNGVTPRRFLYLINPELSQLITSKIGLDWITQLESLKKLEPFATDPEFQNVWRQIKLNNKIILCKHVEDATGIKLNPDTLFDVQVKRIHEYKRQHLNVLHIITLYNKLKQNPNLDIVPRTFIFGGKAAPGYFMAKLIIKLINSVAEVVNNDPTIQNKIKVVFYPNFNVKNAQIIYPAADLSEQISTAGKEASGTSNMKLSMNGALTIGTLDGANIEIRKEVGEDNFFLFGLTADQINETWKNGYNPRDIYNNNADLRAAVDLISNGFFSHGDTKLFKPLLDNLMYQDPYRVFADYNSYVNCQEEVSDVYRDQKRWTEMSILNVARIGKFSSDRSIRDYCQWIWQISPTTEIVHAF